jgi:hypothetical protein
MDIFRTREGAMVASEAITESKAVKVSSSAVDKIEEVLSKKKQEIIPDQT